MLLSIPMPINHWTYSSLPRLYGRTNNRICRFGHHRVRSRSVVSSIIQRPMWNHNMKSITTNSYDIYNNTWQKMNPNPNSQRRIRHVSTDDSADRMIDHSNPIDDHQNVSARPNHHYNDKQTRPPQIKIAIVGAGPSGCYTAKYLIKALQQHPPPPSIDATVVVDYQIDVLERLPTPYGLVRYGVAPDHPEVKNVQNDFDRLFQNDNHNDNHNNNSSSNHSNPIQFLGNVQVGVDLHLQELRQLYSMVVLCYGCDSDRKLVFPTVTTVSSSTDPHGTTTNPHSNDIMMSAREFVAWYNGTFGLFFLGFVKIGGTVSLASIVIGFGHPHFDHIGPQLENIFQKSSSSTGTNVVIVGHGNVALDCARILAKGGGTTSIISPTETNDLDDTSTSTTKVTTVGGLYDTDITTRAWNLLQEYPVSHISVVGRRGHVQASFTIKEVRELAHLKKEGYDVSFIVRKDELDMCTATTATQDELNGPSGRPKTRIDKLLRDAASEVTYDECKRTVNLRFLLNPVRLETSLTDPTSLVGVVFERNTLTGEAGKQRATGTGDFETIPACLVLVSIGYKGVAIPGTEQWFDVDTGTIRNNRGRVDIRTTELGGLYTSGWIKRGPNGIIGTNIADAKETVATIIADLESEPMMKSGSVEGITDIRELLKRRGVQVVDWNGYRRIDEKERTMLRSEHQPREKIVKLEDQLAVAL